MVIGERFPWSALQSAPSDQQLATLQCGDEVLLENLIEGLRSVRLRVPDFHLRFDLGSAAPSPASRIDTLRIDGERGTAEVVVRAVVPVTPPLGQLSVHVGFTLTERVASPSDAFAAALAQVTANVEGDPSVRPVAPFPLGSPKPAPVDSVAAASALWGQSARVATAQPRQPATLNGAPTPSPPSARPPPTSTPQTPPPHADSVGASRAAVRATTPPGAGSKPVGPSLGDRFRERAKK